MWIDTTNVDSKKQRLRWSPAPPPPPKPPPCRIIYNNGQFVGPEDEFQKWKQEPSWRRFFGCTEWDRKRKAARNL